VPPTRHGRSPATYDFLIASARVVRDNFDFQLLLSVKLPSIFVTVDTLFVFCMRDVYGMHRKSNVHADSIDLLILRLVFGDSLGLLENHEGHSRKF